MAWESLVDPAGHVLKHINNGATCVPRAATCGVSMVMFAVGVYVLVEVMFWAYIRLWLVRKLETPTHPPDHHRTYKEILALIVDTAECIQEIYDPKDFISRWFRGVPSEQVKTGNMLDFLAWAAYANKRFSDLNAQDAAWITEQQDVLGKRFGLEFEEGKTPGLEPCWMTLEKLDYHHRSLSGWYLALWFIQAVGYVVFYSLGFRRMTHGRMVYWIRRREDLRLTGALGNYDIDNEDDDAKLPLVFFHGISPGLSVYAMLILQFARGRTSILFESPHINLSLGCLSPPTRLETIQTVEAICAKHDITRCAVMGHSFGSIKAGWLATSSPNLVAQLILLDPVSILLMLPDVCYNFIYRRPTRFMEHVIHWLASKELTVANTLKRHFWWFENVLLVVDVKCPMVVMLAEGDEVLPVHAVREHLRRVGKAEGRHPIDVVWVEEFSHAQCLFSQRVISEVRSRATRQELKYCRYTT